MSDPLRILVLADCRSFHTGRYVSELRRQNCHVSLVSLEEGVDLEFKLKRRGVFKSLEYAAASFEIHQLARQCQPDVINPHFASGYGFSAALAGVRKLAPVVLQLWGSDILIVPKKSSLHRWKTKFALRRADCVLGDSDFVLNEAERLVPLRKRRTIPWGIEQEFLKLAKTDLKTSEPLRVIVPRPLERVYNNVFLLETLAPMINAGKIIMTFPDFGGLVEEFRSRASEVCGDRIQFYPKMPRQGFLALLAKHDVYLSGAISDSSPVSLLEAMGLGLIPIAADIPGVREWLSDESGFTFELNSADSLRQVIEAVVEKADSLDQMRQGNMVRVRQEAVFENNMSETIEIMRGLVGDRKT